MRRDMAYIVNTVYMLRSTCCDTPGCEGCDIHATIHPLCIYLIASGQSPFDPQIMWMYVVQFITTYCNNNTNDEDNDNLCMC